MAAAEGPGVWREVDAYIERLFAPPEEVLAAALRDAAAAGLPEIHVSPNEGKLLYLLARLSGARRMLEIGLLGGYSALWLARALPPEGKLISLELEEKYAGVARRNLARAGLAAQVEIRIGQALDSLARMRKEGEPPFDLVFIDADKSNYPAYLDAALPLLRPGALILADNVIRDGKVLRTENLTPDLEGIREFNRKLAAHPNLEGTLLPILRDSLDGLAIARVRGCLKIN